MRVLGIMSGTSLDGVDYAVCSIDSPAKPRCEEHWSVAFPARLKARLHRAARNEATTYELGDLHYELGRFYARAARGTDVELAGLHGQTVFHGPGKATLQLGEPACLAEKLGVPVISNFRAADIAAGGQGAPLAPIFHRHVFARKGKHVAVHNLGGISNVTSLDWRTGAEPRVAAFDTGPGNMLIDLAARHVSGGKRLFDQDGAAAAKGVINRALLRKLLTHSYFTLPPPKSTGRELFGEAFFGRALAANLSAEDLLATLTELTAASIGLNYEWFLSPMPDEVILCGGGVQNRWLTGRIEAALRELNPRVIIRGSAEYGWHPQLIEPAAFALLAWLAWHKQPGNIPAATGAKGPRILGQVTPAPDLTAARKDN